MTTQTSRSTAKAVRRSPLGILATATATHGTGRGDDTPLPKLSGFVESSFSPLAYEVSKECLTERPGDGSRTAVVLASLQGDTITEDLAGQRMVSGRVHNPLLFMQATANSVLGYLSREFQITGQMFSLSTLDDPVTELLAMADLLFEDPELERVLVLGVELGGGERVAEVHRELAAGTGRPVPPASPAATATAGLAAAVLLGRPAAGAPVSVRPVSVRPAGGEANERNAGQAERHEAEGSGTAEHPGSIQSLFELAVVHRRLLRDGGSHLLVTAPVAGRAPATFALTAHAPVPGRNETENHADQ
ncbi:MAG: hypothetical protein JO362_09950 [Streptomycetaceae bacterium]|nr:hypothetical protein [Streptomycetaceae bacterium]